MKVSEAIDQLEVRDTVWVKATANAINFEGGYIRAENTKTSIYLDGDAEISLTEPQAEKVEVPDFVAKWFKANKISLESNIAAAFRRIGSDKHYTKGSIYEWLNDSSNEPIQTLFKMKNGYTVKPKRWVVKNEEGRYFVAFSKYAKTPFEGVFSASVTDLVTFDDKAKAEAVAVLAEGSVEEV